VSELEYLKGAKKQKDGRSVTYCTVLHLCSDSTIVFADYSH